MRTASNRALAHALGVSETAVRKAEKAGRIRRAGDGSWDVEQVKAAWRAQHRRGQQREVPQGPAPGARGSGRGGQADPARAGPAVPPAG